MPNDLKMFDSALSKLHCIKSMNISKRKRARNLIRNNNTLAEDIKLFKK